MANLLVLSIGLFVFCVSVQAVSPSTGKRPEQSEAVLAGQKYAQILNNIRGANATSDNVTKAVNKSAKFRSGQNDEWHYGDPLNETAADPVKTKTAADPPTVITAAGPATAIAAADPTTTTTVSTTTPAPTRATPAQWHFGVRKTTPTTAETQPTTTTTTTTAAPTTTTTTTTITPTTTTTTTPPTTSTPTTTSPTTALEITSTSTPTTTTTTTQNPVTIPAANQSKPLEQDESLPADSWNNDAEGALEDDKLLSEKPPKKTTPKDSDSSDSSSSSDSSDSSSSSHNSNQPIVIVLPAQAPAPCCCNQCGAVAAVAPVAPVARVAETTTAIPATVTEIMTTTTTDSPREVGRGPNSTVYQRLRKAILTWQAVPENNKLCGTDPDNNIEQFMNDYEACTSYRIVKGCKVKSSSLVGWNVAVLTSTGLICTGTLVSNRHVSFAAVCVQDKITSPDQVTVLFNQTTIIKNNFENYTKSGEWYVYGVKSMGRHPKFRSDVFENNVALLELEKDAPFEKSRIRPACTPQKALAMDATMSADKCIMSSYGATRSPLAKDYNASASGPHSLNFGVFGRKPHERCEKVFPRSYLRERQMCAESFYPNKHTSMCIGDFGSGLLCKMPGNDTKAAQKWHLVGMASYTENICDGPAVVQNMWTGFAADNSSEAALNEHQIKAGGAGGAGGANGANGANGAGGSSGGSAAEPVTTTAAPGIFQQIAHVVLTPMRLGASLVDTMIKL